MGCYYRGNRDDRKIDTKRLPLHVTATVADLQLSGAVGLSTYAHYSGRKRTYQATVIQALLLFYLCLVKHFRQ